MELAEAIERVAARPDDIQARADLAVVLGNLGVPEAKAVWKATARAAGGRGRFFVALALARGFLEGEHLDEVLRELSARFGATRLRKGPRYEPPPMDPVPITIPDDAEEMIWLAVRLAMDVDGLMFPKYARMPAIPVFEEMPEAEFVALAREVEPVALSDGHPLVKQDEVDRAVYVLVKGQAKAVKRRPDGEELELGVRSGPTVLGEMALLTAVPRRTSLTALGPGLAWRIDAERLAELGRSQAALIERMRALVKERLLSDLLNASEVLRAVEHRHALVRAFTVRSFGPRTEVFPQGAPAPGLYFMLYGAAEVRITGRDGQTKTVATLTEGDAFGEMSLLTGEPTTAAIYLPDGGITLHLPAEAYHQIRGAVPTLEKGLAELMDVRVGELQSVFTPVEPDAQQPAIEDQDDGWVFDTLRGDDVV